LLTIVSVIGSSAMLYVKYATETINAKTEDVIKSKSTPKQLFIVKEDGTKIPVVIEDKK